MISFACPHCGRSFTVPISFAGRKAKCKTCGGPIIVPAAPAPEPLPAAEEIAAPKVPVRTRRLLSDQQQMAAAFDRSPIVTILGTDGTPPDVYRLEYHVRSVEKLKGKKPVYREAHQVEIRMTADYPRLAPQCRMLTPVFHPNIDATTICVGDHWTAGERLADLAVRIGEMLAYQAYNIKSPLNGDAAMWADLNGKEFPTDARPLRPAGVD